MTPHLVYARGLTAGALLSAAAAAYLTTTSTPLWSLPVVYVAGLLAWCAQREYAFHRARLVEHEKARRAAYVQQPPPCCQFWRHSDGAVHGPRCTRQTDPTAELYAACCAAGFVSRGTDHEPTCPTRTTRSSAA